MCELFAMAAKVPSTVQWSLEEFSRHGGLSGPHKDGWGIAWYDEREFVRELGGVWHSFAHNGDLADIERDARMRAGAYRPVGETDSELASCALLERLRGLDRPGPNGAIITTARAMTFAGVNTGHHQALATKFTTNASATPASAKLSQTARLVQ